MFSKLNPSGPPNSGTLLEGYRCDCVTSATHSAVKCSDISPKKSTHNTEITINVGNTHCFDSKTRD